MNKALIKKIVYGVAALFAVIAIIMLAAPALSAKVGDGSASGADVAFGNKDKGFAFSFLYFLPYLLVIIGLAFTVVALLGKLGKVAPIVAIVCYVVAAVLFFLPVQAFSIDAPAGMPAEYVNEYKKVMADAMNIGIGAIMAAIFSIVAAAGTAVAAFVLKDE